MKIQICFCLKQVIDRRQQSKASKKDFNNSEMALNIVRIAKMHIRFISFLLFKSKVTDNSDDFPMSTFKDPNNLKHFTNFCMLFGLSQLKDNSHELYQCGYFAKGVCYSDQILDAMKALNLRIRECIFNIMEAMDIRDEFLCSAVGN